MPQGNQVLRYRESGASGYNFQFFCGVSTRYGKLSKKERTAAFAEQPVKQGR